MEIVWAIATLVLLILITIALPRVSSWSARGPYLLLIFVTLASIVTYVLGAISVRATIDDIIRALQLISATSFFGAVADVFLPTVVLYLLHLRGNVLRGVKGNAIIPIASRLWKRILDWSWAILTFLLHMVVLGYQAAWRNNMLNSDVTMDQIHQFININNSIIHGIVALKFLLCLNVFISLIVHFVQSKHAQARDPVTMRLLILAAPFFLIYAIESVAVDIIINVKTPAILDIDMLNLAGIIIHGICRTVILIALLTTMLFPNVQWKAKKAGMPMEEGDISVQQQQQKQWSTPTSSWTQPLYNQK